MSTGKTENIGLHQWMAEDKFLRVEFNEDNVKIDEAIGGLDSALNTKQPAITASGILKGDGSGGVSAAAAGTDYVLPSGSITGNAATATRLATSCTIALSGDATASGSFNGSANLTLSTTLANSGVTAGSYGPSANASPAHAGTFEVPCLTVDAKGRVTAASTKTITLPSDSNTDTKVTQTVTTTDAAYPLLTAATASKTATSTEAARFASGVTLNPSTKTITATTFSGALSGNAATATKLATARTIRTNLASTSTASFNGSANITPGVTGTLAIGNGGTGNTAGYIRTGKKSGTTVGNYATAEGLDTTASGTSSHAEGSDTTASGMYSHAEGCETTASGSFSHAEGYGTIASANNSHAEGGTTVASASNSHAEGVDTTATNYASHAQGKYNKAMTTGGASNNTTGDAMVIGNGTGTSALSNAFRVTYAGAVYGKAAYNASGADYAEFFEWKDGNPEQEDRIGRFVTMDGDKIVTAGEGDYLLGIVSGNPCLVGNSDEDWLGRWEMDEFGRFIKEETEERVTRTEVVETPVLDGEGSPTGETTLEIKEVETGEVIRGWRYKANPGYDPEQPYTERKDRPEWDYIGMLGVLAVCDDGTCEVNGYCKAASGGIATRAERYIPGETCRVIQRITDSIVKVVFR